MEKRLLTLERKSKYTNWVLDLVLIALTLVIGLLLYWHLRPYNVLEPSSGNYQLEKTEYSQGEKFEIPFRICKLLDYPETSTGQFTDGVIFSRPDIKSNFDVKCYDTYLTSVKIPETLPAGTYTYSETIIYNVNPVREVRYEFSTQPFEVLEKCDNSCSE
jgi:hypothetical protein